jgi:hypothetical protein
MRPWGFGFGGQDILSEVLEAEAIEDLVDGNVDGFAEDEMLADIF